VDDLASLRRQVLDAREARQAIIDRAVGPSGSLLFVSTNVPGADKSPPGLDACVFEARHAIVARLPATVLHEGRDALGPWALYRLAVAAHAAKLIAVDIEQRIGGGRLLDLDVVSADGRQVDRASLGLPPRPCLACARPAFECIRLRRHSGAEVQEAAARLLAPCRLSARRLAACLVAGARMELELTPKPGLVDRIDCGSHPDLSYEAMSASIDLLPAYFDDLLAIGEPLDLAACVAAGQRAEHRMVETIGANAHKGYIFLAGLILLAARTAANPETLRSSISMLAHRVLDPRAARDAAGPSPSHGQRARAEHGVGGVCREALEGLPSVFESGLPFLEAARCPPLSPDTRTGHLLMAVLMQTVEDSTAVHRCGPAGLSRLRSDGARLQRLIEAGDDYVPWLGALNDEYRRLDLTMGGVADCMALCFTLHAWFA